MDNVNVYSQICEFLYLAVYLNQHKSQYNKHSDMYISFSVYGRMYVHTESVRTKSMSNVFMYICEYVRTHWYVCDPKCNGPSIHMQVDEHTDLHT